MSAKPAPSLPQDAARRVDHLLGLALAELRTGAPKLDELAELLAVARLALDVARGLEPCPEDCDEGLDDDGEPCAACRGRGWVEPAPRPST